MDAKNILLTGPPGCGKSTLIEKLARRMHRPLTGFFTREIREKGRRVGFSINTLDGEEGIMAHVQSHSLERVGRYGVNVESFERIAVPAISPRSADFLVVIDEIGKMECLSPCFREALQKILDSENRVIGSIALKGGSFIEKIKVRSDVRLVPVSRENRDLLLESLPAIMFRETRLL